MIKTNTATKDGKHPSNTTWLQGIGYAYGKPAGQLQVGDVMAWNYGGTSTVVSIDKQTEKTITITESAPDSYGYVGSRTMRKNKIVAMEILS